MCRWIDFLFELEDVFQVDQDERNRDATCHLEVLDLLAVIDALAHKNRQIENLHHRIE
jgi:hypothetical protein